MSAGVSVGGTNNATSEAEVAGSPTSDGGEADGFTRVSLGATYRTRGARFTQELSYLFGAYVYVASADSVAFNNDLGYQATLNLTPDTELGLQLAGQQGRTSELTLLNRLGGAQSVARPAGAETYLSASAGQRLNLQLDPFWSVGEDASAQIFAPVSDDTRQARTWGVNGGLSLNRLWTQDTGSLYARGGHGRSGEVKVDGLVIFPARRANWAEAGASWSHSWGEDWGTYLGAGALYVQVPQIRDPFVDLGLHALVTYLTPTGGEVALRADRGVYTNVFVGDVLLQNSIGISGTHPFGYKEAWQVGGSVDYQQSESVFVIDVRESNLQVLAVAGLVTFDWTRHRRLLFEVNYTYQDSGEAVRNGMRVEPFTLHRLMAMATLEFVFPEPEEGRQQRRRRGARGARGGRPGGSSAPSEDSGAGRSGPETGASGREESTRGETRGDGPSP